MGQLAGRSKAWRGDKRLPPLGTTGMIDGIHCVENCVCLIEFSFVEAQQHPLRLRRVNEAGSLRRVCVCVYAKKVFFSFEEEEFDIIEFASTPKTSNYGCCERLSVIISTWQNLKGKVGGEESCAWIIPKRGLEDLFREGFG